MDKPTNAIPRRQIQASLPPPLEPGGLAGRVRRLLYLLALLVGLPGLVVGAVPLKIGAVLLMLAATAILLRLETLLLVTLALLPLHGAILLLVFDLSPASDLRALRVAQAWKELLIVAIIGRVLWQRYGPGQAGLESLKPGAGRKRFNPLDLVIIFFVVINLAFLVLVPGPFNFYTKLQAVRYQAFFAALYLIGRLILPSPFLQTRLIKVCLWAGGITALGAIAERFLTTEQYTHSLGVTDYFTALYGAGAFAKDYNTDLPAFFISSCGFQRSGSFMLAPLDVAHEFIFTIAIGLVTLVGVYRKKATIRKKIGLVGLLVAMVVGLGLAYSRASLLILVFEIGLLVFLMSRGKQRIILPVGVLLLAMAIVGLSLIVGGEGWRSCLADTATGRESSVYQHSNALRESLQATLRNPFGYGLATSGSRIAGDTDFNSIGGESAYAITAVQLGVGGLLGLLALVVSPALFWLSYLAKAKPPTRLLALVGTVYFPAMALLFLSTQPWVFGFATWTAWLMTGLGVSQSFSPQRDTEGGKFSPQGLSKLFDKPLSLITSYSLGTRFGYRAGLAVVGLAAGLGLAALLLGQRVQSNLTFARLEPTVINRAEVVGGIRGFPMRLLPGHDYSLSLGYRSLDGQAAKFRLCFALRDARTNPSELICSDDPNRQPQLASGQRQTTRFDFRSRNDTFTGEVIIINQSESQLEIDNLQVVRTDAV